MTPQTPQTQSRAPRMSVEARRESILDAVVPLLLRHGADVTTKEIADAAGIAEGTIFRAFVDKDELVQQAVARFMNPEPTYRALEQIDASMTLEAKVTAVIDIFRERSAGIADIVSALGHRKPPHEHNRDPRADARAQAIFTALFAPDCDRLRVDQSLAVFFIELLAFGSSMPMFTTDRGVDTDELVDFILRGIVKEGR